MWIKTLDGQRIVKVDSLVNKTREIYGNTANGESICLATKTMINCDADINYIWEQLTDAISKQKYFYDIEAAMKTI